MIIPDPPDVAEPSLEDLLDRMQPRMRRVLSRFRIPSQDAEDVLQETFLILVTKWGTIRNTEAWLLATLSNRCIIYWRKARARLWDLVDETLLEILSEAESPEQEQSDLRFDLATVLARLPDRCRAVLELRYGLGCSTSEAAERTGYCKSSIRKVTRRCLAALSAELMGSGFRLELPVGE